METDKIYDILLRTLENVCKESLPKKRTSATTRTQNVDEETNQPQRKNEESLLYTSKGENPETILERLAPNVGLKENNNARRGRLCIMEDFRGNIAEDEVTYLFNAAPRSVRDMRGISVDRFKHQLDK
ncbi:hypothetical protein E2C01_042216 [Portunus trituberculatus]|uniref:Uncharacterized protein n=1 Tax=Portunus trituberculatus TaxID=210409 RepID=A0A5B7FVV8_PORTR|nr:hypothetical protein [Portunus trituberculatus]